MGIYLDKRSNVWCARLQVDGKDRWFESHKTKAAAEKAYKIGSAPYQHLVKDWHGFTNTPKGSPERKFYTVWGHMRNRCLSKNDTRYKHYGGRGIRLEWKTFTEFKRDMYKSFLRHNKKHGGLNTSIERIDNDGNYSKANCRWATMDEQRKNKQKLARVGIRGERSHLSRLTEAQVRMIRKIGLSRPKKEVAKQFGIGVGTLNDILGRRRWAHI